MPDICSPPTLPRWTPFSFGEEATRYFFFNSCQPLCLTNLDDLAPPCSMGLFFNPNSEPQLRELAREDIMAPHHQAAEAAWLSAGAFGLLMWPIVIGGSRPPFVQTHGWEVSIVTCSGAINGPVKR